MEQKGNKSLIGICIVVLILIIGVVVIISGCSIKKYTVKFYSDGGSNIEPVKVKRGTTIDKPKDPIKDGYVFDGWYYGQSLFDFDTEIDKNMTLIARWHSNNIVIKNENITLSVDDTGEIIISSLPNKITEQDLIFTSSDDSIVTIDENGKIKAIKSGSAIITIKSNDGKYSATCNVTINEKTISPETPSENEEVIEIESMSISGSNSVVEGNVLQLTIILNPTNATNKNITWQSSNPNVATVDNNGKVTALMPGVVTITATSSSGKTATQEITITKAILPNTVKISGSNEVGVGGSIKLSATIDPSNATNKTLTWSSSNTGIAKVDATGKVTGVKVGTATITVKTANGKSATKEIKVVNIDVTKITISGTKEIYVGNSTTLKAAITPNNATNKNISWSVNNTEIATIDSKGKLTGKKAGQVIITAKAANGVSATYTVTVKEKAASYVITLTAIHQEVTGAVTQYKIMITKNGAILSSTEFLGFTYNNKDHLSSETSISINQIDTNIKTATIKLKDGSSVTATVKHIN